jgi:hypothetical protein
MLDRHAVVQAIADPIAARRARLDSQPAACMFFEQAIQLERRGGASAEAHLQRAILFYAAAVRPSEHEDAVVSMGGRVEEHRSSYPFARKAVAALD